VAELVEPVSAAGPRRTEEDREPVVQRG